MKMGIRIMFLLKLFVLFFLTSCARNSIEPEENIINNAPQLDEAFAQAETVTNIKSLIVSYNGSIVREKYWRNGGTNNIHDVRSVTKTVTGLLIGIAIEKGFIKSIDQPIEDFSSLLSVEFPQDKSSITIKHLLTMSGGFLWDELISVSGYNNWIGSPNQILYVLNTPMANNPGQVFTYNSGAIHLLSAIITASTGVSTKQFAETYLFNPLGFKNVVWETDHQGIYNGGAGLQMSPRDMVKIGELIRNKGIYNGNRIVSEAWINQAIQFQISTGNAQPFATGYGYCLWTGKANNIEYYFANGWGGQFLVVVPSLNLVVSATNEWSGVSTSIANNQWYSTLNIIINKILPAFNK